MNRDVINEAIRDMLTGRILRSYRIISDKSGRGVVVHGTPTRTFNMLPPDESDPYWHIARHIEALLVESPEARDNFIRGVAELVKPDTMADVPVQDAYDLHDPDVLKDLLTHLGEVINAPSGVPDPSGTGTRSTTPTHACSRWPVSSLATAFWPDAEQTAWAEKAQTAFRVMKKTSLSLGAELAEARAGEEAAFNAGYSWGYGNGHTDADQGEDYNSDPKGAYRLWVDEDERGHREPAVFPAEGFALAESRATIAAEQGKPEGALPAILREVAAERERAGRKHGRGLDRPLTRCEWGARGAAIEGWGREACDVPGAATWADILGEEVGEALQADGPDLREELIQVAAMAAGFVEAFDHQAMRAAEAAKGGDHECPRCGLGRCGILRVPSGCTAGLFHMPKAKGGDDAADAMEPTCCVDGPAVVSMGIGIGCEECSAYWHPGDEGYAVLQRIMRAAEAAKENDQ